MFATETPLKFGQAAAGGAIYTSGDLVLEDSVFRGRDRRTARPPRARGAGAARRAAGVPRLRSASQVTTASASWKRVGLGAVTAVDRQRAGGRAVGQRTQHLAPGPQVGGALHGVALSEMGGDAGRRPVASELLEQPRLADARLPADQHHAAVASLRLGKRRLPRSRAPRRGRGSVR
jgi:hypothetical protein